MVKVITYGTFDTFHYGHLELLLRAKALGDYLIVGVSTDEFNAVKGKRSMFDQATRMKWVNSISCVNLVIPESSWDQKLHDIDRYGVSVFVMGDDWAGKFDELPCQVVYLPRTPSVSSTVIKGAL